MMHTNRRNKEQGIRDKLIHQRESGQLLIEVLISILVGGLFLVGTTLAIVSIIRYNFESRTSQATAFQAADSMNFLEQVAAVDWTSIYDLDRGTSTPYFIVHGTSSSAFVQGEESVLMNDVTYGLIGHWKFDETATATGYDSSGNLANAETWSGTPTRLSDTDCLAGGCLDLSGSTDSVLVSDEDSTVFNFGPNEDFTIMLWIKTTQPGENNNWPAIFGRNDAISMTYHHGWGFILHDEDNPGWQQWSFSLHKEDYGVYEDAGGSSDIADGTWHHIVGMRDGDTVKAYEDGVLTPYQSTAAWVGSNSFDMTRGICAGIFACNEGNDDLYHFNGVLDDIRIYDRALSSNEIKQIYESKINIRSFSVFDVHRDGEGDIAEPSGNTLDPSTLRIRSMATTEETKEIVYEEYITRSNARTFSQTGWSDGYGIEGPATTTPIGYATSSNISASGVLSLATTTASGWLESTTYDTQDANGITMHSMLWQGTLPASTVVKFQIAATSTDSGPWSYIGPDGTDSSFYTPSAAGVQAEIWNIQNSRYFRYKIFLEPSGGSGPTVEDVHINWAP